MANVYSYIDYIQVETTDTIDAEGVEVTEVQQLGNDGEELGKRARTKKRSSSYSRPITCQSTSCQCNFKARH